MVYNNVRKIISLKVIYFFNIYLNSIHAIQYELADYNNDGSVDIADVVGINMNLL